MSEQTKLGTLPGPEAQRDAVHVAIVAVKAGMRLAPGALVRMDKTPKGEPIAVQIALSDQVIGVVDPFLSASVESGKRFWLCLRPGTITGMRHHWEHPAFPDSMEKPALEAQAVQRAISEAWLLSFIQAYWPGDRPYKRLLDDYIANFDKEQQICFGVTGYYNALEEGGEDSDTCSNLKPEFWHHWERYTGKSRPAGTKSFRCAC